MRLLVIAVGAVVIAGLVALGIRKFLEMTMRVDERHEERQALRRVMHVRDDEKEGRK